MVILGQITAVVLLGVGVTGLIYSTTRLIQTYMGEGDDYTYESTHHCMTKDNCRQYAYGTFEQFLAEFNKREWERDEGNPKSFFGKDRTYPRPDYIHAGIIRFGGVGMLLRGGDYKKFVKWEKEHSLEHEKAKDRTPLWEDVKKEEV